MARIARRTPHTGPGRPAAAAPPGGLACTGIRVLGGLPRRLLDGTYIHVYDATSVSSGIFHSAVALLREILLHLYAIVPTLHSTRRSTCVVSERYPVPHTRRLDSRAAARSPPSPRRATTRHRVALSHTAARPSAGQLRRTRSSRRRSAGPGAATMTASRHSPRRYARRAPPAPGSSPARKDVRRCSHGARATAAHASEGPAVGSEAHGCWLGSWAPRKLLAKVSLPGAARVRGRAPLWAMARRWRRLARRRLASRRMAHGSLRRKKSRRV